MYLSSRATVLDPVDPEPGAPTVVTDADPADDAVEPAAAPGPTTQAPAAPPTGRRPAATVVRFVGTTVILLGLTSLFTDISSEMVGSVLPIYLTTTMGFTPLQIGAVDGALPVIAALLCLVTAVVADRRRRHKELATAGYAASTICRLGLVLAGGVWAPMVGFLYLDRVGKGIRTAPRDALISMSSTRATLGRSFGVHRAFDTAGAVAGPIVAAYLLARSTGSFQGVFVTSFCVACIGLAIIVLFVHNPRRRAERAGSAAPGAAPTATVVAPRPRLRTLAARPSVRRILVLALAVGLLSPGDALVFLLFQRTDSLSNAVFPLLYVGTGAVFLVLAVPLGRLSDRVGARRVLVLGVVAQAGTFALLASPLRGWPGGLALFALYGTAYAGTDAIFAARMSRAVPREQRAAGLALLAGALSVAQLGGALLFGSVWQAVGPTAAAALFAGGLVVVAVGLASVRSTTPDLLPGDAAPTDEPDTADTDIADADTDEPATAVP